MPSSEEWAYLAGIIDGEGSIQLSHSVTSQGNGFKYMIRIYNTDLSLIAWVEQRFGGNTRVHNRGETGEAFGKKPVHMVDWRNVDSLGDILQGTLPYLVVKKQKAQALMSFITVPYEEVEMRQIALKEFKELKT